MTGSKTAGYSGTPLAKKLGIAPSSRVLLIDAPREYEVLVAPLPEDAVCVTRRSASVTLVHVFATQRRELADHLATLRKVLPPQVPVWVSWPKRSAKRDTDITEDTIREVALPLGFVDIKVCAVSEVWSGLKLVVRKELR